MLREESTGIRRRRFDVKEYHRMGRAEVLSEGERVELVSGEVIETAPIDSPHQSCVDVPAQLLWNFSGGRYIVRVQGPVRLNNLSEPQPNLAILQRRQDFYRSSHPAPEDVLLLIEVSDTLTYDREVKLPLYARSGIPEVWIANPTSATVEVFFSPSEGSYSESHRYGREEELRSATLAHLSLPVAGIFGESSEGTSG